MAGSPVRHLSAVEAVRDWGGHLGSSIVSVVVSRVPAMTPVVTVDVRPTRPGACGARFDFGIDEFDVYVGRMGFENVRLETNLILDICRALELGQVREWIATVAGIEVWSDGELHVGREVWSDKRYNLLSFLSAFTRPRLRTIEYRAYRPDNNPDEGVIDGGRP